MLLSLLTLIAPLTLLLAAGFAFRAQARRSDFIRLIPQCASVLGMLGVIVAAVLMAMDGPDSVPLLGPEAFA
ncbi:MAG: hypothetical protein P1V34_18750, partial [Alphaproteobacteria bacterium]|nr:hypothetical protein [Alphaproteobacteria bacterium]